MINELFLRILNTTADTLSLTRKRNIETTMHGFMEEDLRKLELKGWTISTLNVDEDTYFVTANKFIKGCRFVLFSDHRSNANKS